MISLFTLSSNCVLLSNYSMQHADFCVTYKSLVTEPERTFELHSTVRKTMHTSCTY